MKFKSLIFILLALGYVSCSETDIPELNTQSEEIIPETVNVNDPHVSLSLAQEVAKSVRLATRSESEVQSIKTEFDSSGTPLFYAVNFADSKGFVLVSATKDFTPVLAEVDSGSYDIMNMPPNVKYYLEDYKQAIRYSSQAPADSIRKYRTQWLRYMNQEPSKKKLTRSVSAEEAAFIFDSQRNWQNNGCRWTSLSNNELGFDNFEYVVDEVLDSEPDMDLNKCFIVWEPIQVHRDYVDEMITTRWDQFAPYNSGLTGEFTGFPIGCVTVALGQIMKYNMKPAYYDWDNMRDTYSFTENASNVAALLIDIGDAANVAYASNGSGTTIYNALNALKQFGYTNAGIISHNLSRVKDDIMSGHPVYGRGNRSDGVGHAWVYDGINNPFYTYYYFLYILRDDPGSTSYWKFKWDKRELQNDINMESIMIHINWGYSGNYNGWFVDNNISFTSDGQVKHYSNNKMDIINIK